MGNLTIPVHAVTHVYDTCLKLLIKKVNIDVYGRPVTAKGKFQFAFEGKFYKFPKVSTGACLVNSFPADNFSRKYRTKID